MMTAAGFVMVSSGACVSFSYACKSLCDAVDLLLGWIGSD